MYPGRWRTLHTHIFLVTLCLYDSVILILSSKVVFFYFREIVSYKRNVQNNKQYLSALLRRAKERRLEPYTVPSPPSPTGATMGASSDETNEEPKVEPVSKINPKWTQEELLLGVEGACHKMKLPKLNVKCVNSDIFSLKHESSIFRSVIQP